MHEPQLLANRPRAKAVHLPHLLLARTTKPVPLRALAVPPEHHHPATDFLRERRVLEQQRLARMNKGQARTRQYPQKRSYSASLSEDESDGDPRPLKRKPSKKPVASFSSTTSAAEDVGEMFWNGELRQTANRHTERTDKKPTFRISEIIGDVSRSFAARRSVVTDGGE
jgi:tyrosyl-DNA phosphodiesterase-1